MSPHYLGNLGSIKIGIARIFPLRTVGHIKVFACNEPRVLFEQRNHHFFGRSWVGSGF